MDTELEADFIADTAMHGEVTTMEAVRRQRMAAFLEAYETMGWVEAARTTGVSDPVLLGWRRRFPEFKAAMDARNDAVALALERVADEIATGRMAASPAQVAMLQFRLKGLRPEVYRERASVQLDATARPQGDGSADRARLLLATWQGTAGTAPATG